MIADDAEVKGAAWAVADLLEQRIHLCLGAAA